MWKTKPCRYYDMCVNYVFGFRFVGTDNRSESPEMDFRPENAFHCLF